MLGGSSNTDSAPASAACSIQRWVCRLPYAATPGISPKPAGRASAAVWTTRARSSSVRVWYSPSDPLGQTPSVPAAASQATCSA